MSTSDTILLWQTIGVWFAALVAAPFTVWAMFEQTRTAARIAEHARRQECLERLLGTSEPRGPQGSADFYRTLNAVPVIFAREPGVLTQYRDFRSVSVQREEMLREPAYRLLLVRMAAACDLPLTNADVAAALGPQWHPTGKS